MNLELFTSFLTFLDPNLNCLLSYFVGYHMELLNLLVEYVNRIFLAIFKLFDFVSEFLYGSLFVLFELVHNFSFFRSLKFNIHFFDGLKLVDHTLLGDVAVLFVLNSEFLFFQLNDFWMSHFRKGNLWLENLQMDVFLIWRVWSAREHF